MEAIAIRFLFALSSGYLIGGSLYVAFRIRRAMNSGELVHIPEKEQAMNKRIRLYREGTPTIDGRLLVETTWAPEPIPLLIQTQRGVTDHWDTKIIGTVEHIRRGLRDGWVTGVIKTPADPKGLFAEADFDVVEINEELSTETITVINSARLRAVTLGMRPAWKEMTRT